MSISDNSRTPRKVVLMLHEGFPATPLGLLHDAFSVANWQAGRRLYDLTLAASDNASTVRSFGGLPAQTHPIDALDPGEIDHLALLVSFDPLTAAYSERVAGLIRQAYRRGAGVYGVETGAAVMAAAGLLSGGEAAVHWANRDGFQEAFPDVALSDAPVAAHQRCLTCVGGGDVIDLALIVIERDCGRRLALQVAEHMNRGEAYGALRQLLAGAPSPARPASPALATALARMEETLEDPISCEEIAAEAGLSLRQLERLFLAELGASPKGHYRALRLTRAQNLLQQTTLSVAEVATSAGFASFPHFARTYKAHFGVPPSRDRRQDPSASVPAVFLDPALLREESGR
ncbi:MAG: helix-turn-helix domain-containing protein [Marivibrio sp.]|uniref:GlxA family transcriptional regulator n=1 Tax=Marivibrio sp. TaxID=2039719 RepID=UPI0032EF06BF